VWPDDADPSVFFGEDVRSRKGIRKAMELCKQVERAEGGDRALDAGVPGRCGGGDPSEALPEIVFDVRLAEEVGRE
jgi:hypothetical protein